MAFALVWARGTAGLANAGTAPAFAALMTVILLPVSLWWRGLSRTACAPLRSRWSSSGGHDRRRACG
jgi:hypothetical protein